MKYLLSLILCICSIVAQPMQIPAPMQKLLVALRNGDVAVIRAEIAAGRIGIPKEQLPLWAYKKASLEALKEAGIPLFVRDSSGMTAFHIAAQNEEIGAVSFLLDCGAKVNERDDFDRTALFFAAGNSSTDVVNLLLRSGADVNCQNRSGVTPLMHAASQGSEPVFMFLLSAEANTHITDKEGRTVQHYVDEAPEHLADTASKARKRKRLAEVEAIMNDKQKASVAK
jgi:ankyrin repeat protein